MRAELEKYLDRPTAPTTSQIEEHLVMCDRCVTYAEQMELTVALLGNLRDADPAQPPPALVAALQARRAAGR